MSVQVFTPESAPSVGYHPSVFLGGGITGCPDWQSHVIRHMIEWNVGVVLFNPRREVWAGTGSDGPEAVKQIAWEHEHLVQADIVSFWFPQETLCPITLLELGLFLRSDVDLVVSCHQDYQRRFDVEQQTALYRPDVQVNVGIGNHVDAIETFVGRFPNYGF